MNVWVCQVRKEAFVGGESQRCRHPRYGETELLGCGEMELIGGEPIDYCVTHQAPAPIGEYAFHQCYEWWLCEVVGDECEGLADPCQFESQVRVGL